MKRLLIIAAVVLLCAGTSGAQRQRKVFGAGIIVGSPFGLTGKYWINSKNAFDGAFSVLSKNDIYFHASYLWHNYRAFPDVEEGRLPFYYGIGPVFYRDSVGARGVAGIDYIFDKYPFDIFLELAPVLTIFKDFDFAFTGGIGARYYFE